MTRRALGSGIYELLSSMRFAVSLLTVLAIASVVGTVLRQAEPYSNYVVQFGQFWFSVFEAIGLYDVYHAAWFLVILAFLISYEGVASEGPPMPARNARLPGECARGLYAFCPQSDSLGGSSREC